MPEDIAKKALEEIKEKKICPCPAWVFALKNIFLWILYVAFTLIGGIAVATIIFLIKEHDWEVYTSLDISFAKYVFISIPYLWLVLFLFFILAAHYELKNTKKGYKYGLLISAGLSLGVSVILGLILFFSGFGYQAHYFFYHDVGFYNKLVYTEEDVWNCPEKGLLSGTITGVNSKNDFFVSDSDNKIWHVMGNNTPCHCVNIAVGEKIKVSGEKKEKDDLFLANEIKHWGPCLETVK